MFVCVCVLCMYVHACVYVCARVACEHLCCGSAGVCAHEYLRACEWMHMYLCVFMHLCFICVRACVLLFIIHKKTALLGKRNIINIPFFKNIFAIVHALLLRNIAIIIHLNNYKYLIIV